LHSIGLELEKEGVQMHELPQTGTRVEADQALYDAIIGRTLRHYNDPVLNEHMKNAVAIETPRGFRLAKWVTSKKIDASVALSMAHHGASMSQESKVWVRSMGHAEDELMGGIPDEKKPGYRFWYGNIGEEPGERHEKHYSLVVGSTRRRKGLP
jgi:phage terminase large subunit-like protein